MVGTKERIKKDLELLKEKNLLRKLKIEDDLIDFSSNDYLGVSHSIGSGELVFNSSSVNSGSGGSRLLSGNYPEIEKLEFILAKVHGKPKALVFNSGYVANLGFFSTVPSKNSVTIYDEKIHACIKDGMRLSLAKKTSFKHNDVVHLEQKLKSFSSQEIFVAIESIYSMDGDQAPIQDIAVLCEKYGAHLVVDEAHSTAVFGRKGSGLVSHLGLDVLVFAKIHTFGKAVGCHGACVVGDEVLIDYLINKSRPFIYTTAMPPHGVNTLLFIYEYLANNYKALQEQISNKIKLFRECINHQEIKSFSPIQVVLVPGNTEVRRVAKELQSCGFDVRPVLSPTVKEGEERLRICLHNFNTNDQIISLAKKINSIL